MIDDSLEPVGRVVVGTCTSSLAPEARSAMGGIAMAVVTRMHGRDTARWRSETKVWAAHQEPCLKPLWIAMLEAGGVGWRTRMLDVGCGTGGALMLGRGLGAELAGIDEDRNKVEFTTNRIRHGDVRTGSLSDLPFGKGRYTLVMSVSPLFISADFEDTWRGMLDACAPGGRLAVAFWDDLADQTKIFESLRTSPCRTLDYEWWTDQVCHADFVYDDVETAWAVQRQFPLVYHAMSEQGEEEVRAAFFGAARRFCEADGRVRMRNAIRILVKTKEP